MNERELELKTKLVANVFNTLAEHRGIARMDYLVSDSISVTNKLFMGIQAIDEDENEEEVSDSEYGKV